MRLEQIVNVLAKQGDRWQFEYAPCLNFRIERGENTRSDLGRQQGVSAKLEEPVVNADALKFENFAIDFR